MAMLPPARGTAPGPGTIAATLLAGTAGGLAALAAGLPLALMLGATIATALWSLSGIAPAGLRPRLPPVLRTIFVPVIGLSIGGTFTPGIFAEARGWWPSLLVLLVFIPAVHLAGYAVLRRAGGIDRPTAFFGAAPGGLLEAVLLGERYGADPAMLTLLQLLRLILTIVLIPLGFLLMTGHPVGTAAGASLGGTGTLSWGEIALLALAGVIGAVGGEKLRLPAAPVLGPMILSAALHLGGWVGGNPPGWLIGATQVVVGATLGSRFAGTRFHHLWRALRLAAVNAAITIGMALLVAQALPGAVDQSARAVFLAFAPGGLAEMSLIALSLQLGTVYVALHHVIRIVIAVLVARSFAGRLLTPRSG